MSDRAPVITDAERRRWQRQAIATLTELLTLTHLPVIDWQVGGSASLVGRPLDSDPAARRAAWQAWVSYLGADPWPERTTAAYTHLHAIAERYGTHRVRIAILADIDTTGSTDE